MKVDCIHNESCLETMRRMDDDCIDMVITSPPYDDLRTYTKESNWNEDMWKQVIAELHRVVKPNGVVVWVVGDATINGSETGSSFKQALYAMECGFDLYDTMIYQKTGTPFPQKVRYNQVFEYMFVFSKGKPKSFNPIMKRNKMAGDVRFSRRFRNKEGEFVNSMNGKAIAEMGIENNVWLITNGIHKSTKDLFAFDHPAIFPELLAERHILTWSERGDVVYDPFMGSGTVAKMCLLNDRRYIGSEVSKEYCDIIQKRIDTAERVVNPKVEWI